jgi:hypothetical protein
MPVPEAAGDAAADSRPLSAERRLESHQPFLHDLTVVLHAPVQAWSAADGEMTGTGAQGVYIGDTRAISDLLCEADDKGTELTPLAVSSPTARELVLRSLVTGPGSPEVGLVLLERIRSADAHGLREALRLRNDDDHPRSLRLRLGIVTDAATMSQVKDPRLLAAQSPDRPEVHVDGGIARWAFGAQGTALLDPRGTATGDGAGGARGTGACAAGELTAEGPVVTWTLTLEAPAHGTAEAGWTLSLTDPAVPFTAVPADAAVPADTAVPARAAGTPVPTEGILAPSGQDGGSARPVGTGSAGAQPVDPEHEAAADLLARSLSDLDALRLQIPGDPSRTFFAAGAPWFFTLFGRDSLLAASLVLPRELCTAEGTLRTLARLQGTRTDPETAEQPGKILHEVRAQGMEMAEGHLPPVYYGTIDATPLWIELLHDALEAGMEPSVREELHGPLVAAARWLLEHADADGDGLLEYTDESGHGLANQGWKDSGDSIRFADGSLAHGAIAPAEVQGYAYAAALHAAQLIERAPVPDPAEADLPSRLRAWAARLRESFAASFWCRDESGPYPALALDGSKQRVDGVSSNMGHLLGTGILEPQQERLVVRRLMDPSLFSGFGIRTLSTTNGGYGPLRYHGGSVWTHDSAVILRGMLRAGFPAEARTLARGLLRAAAGFDQRLPELFSGIGAEESPVPLPYPPSCRLQAWAAASAVPIARALGAL